MRLQIAAALLACVALPGGAHDADAVASKPVEQSAPLLSEAGAIIGTVRLMEIATGTLIYVDVEGLDPGAHGIHIHSVADCDAATGFKSAKGHAGPETAHGFLGPHGPGPGDLPNLHIGQDGRGRAEFFNQRVSLTGNIALSLHDADGSAIVIHAERDDYATQPIGGAGARVACGEIRSP